MLVLAQLTPAPELLDRYGVTGEVVSAAADYSVIGATVGVVAALLAMETDPAIQVSYGEWGAIGAAAAAVVVLVVASLGGA